MTIGDFELLEYIILIIVIYYCNINLDIFNFKKYDIQSKIVRFDIKDEWFTKENSDYVESIIYNKSKKYNRTVIPSKSKKVEVPSWSLIGKL